MLEGVVGAVEGGAGGFLAAKVVVGRSSSVPYQMIDNNNNPSKSLTSVVKRCKRSVGSLLDDWFSKIPSVSHHIRVKREPCLPEHLLSNIKSSIQGTVGKLKSNQLKYFKRFQSRHSLDDADFKRYLRQKWTARKYPKVLVEMRKDPRLSANTLLKRSDIDEIWAVDDFGNFLNLEKIGLILFFSEKSL